MSAVLIASAIPFPDIPMTVPGDGFRPIHQALTPPLRWSGRQPLFKTHALISGSTPRDVPTRRVFARRLVLGSVLAALGPSLFAQEASTDREGVRKAIRSWLDDAGSAGAMASLSISDPELEADFLEWLLMELKSVRKEGVSDGPVREASLLYILNRRLETGGREKLLKVLETTVSDPVRETAWQLYAFKLFGGRSVDPEWVLTPQAVQLAIQHLQLPSCSGILSPLLQMVYAPSSGMTTDPDRQALSQELTRAWRNATDPIAIEILERVMKDVGLDVPLRSDDPALAAPRRAPEEAAGSPERSGRRQIPPQRLPYLSSDPVYVKEGDAQVTLTVVLHGAAAADIAAFTADLQVMVVHERLLRGVAYSDVKGEPRTDGKSVMKGIPSGGDFPVGRIVGFGGQAAFQDGPLAKVLVDVSASRLQAGERVFLWISRVEAANVAAQPAPMNPGHLLPPIYRTQDLSGLLAGPLSQLAEKSDRAAVLRSLGESDLRRLRDRALDPRLIDQIDERLLDIQAPPPARPIGLDRRPSPLTASLLAAA